MCILVDTFLNTYLWSHIEPATAIWCACLMTYRPLFADISLKLWSVFDRSKSTPSNELKLVNIKKTNNDNTGFDSDAGPSLGQNPGGQQSDGYRDLSNSNSKGNLQVFEVPITPTPSDRRFTVHADEYECSRIAGQRGTSLV